MHSCLTFVRSRERHAAQSVHNSLKFTNDVLAHRGHI